MTATVTPTGIQPVRELPNGEIFYSPWGLFPFQIDGIAEIYVRTARADGGMIAVWDTGIGKTVLGIANAAYMLQDDLVDLVIVVCEKNKRYDWRDEFLRFTGLNTLLYHGSGRQARLARNGIPHVLVTTYETGRTELMSRVRNPGKRGRGRASDGPLFEALELRDKRVLWIFDESTKLRNRSTETHKGFDYAIGQLRRGPHHQRVLGLTATPIERGYEDAYNMGRIFCPSRMPTVAEFEQTYTRGTDRFGNPLFDLARGPAFARLFRNCIIRKRKTDPDVIDDFPEIVEKSIVVEPTTAEREFAGIVEELCQQATDAMAEQFQDMGDTRAWQLARITAGHPAAHAHADNPVSKEITAALGIDGLRSIGSSKTAELIERLTPVVKGQGAQVIVFSFFTSVAVEVVRELRLAGFTVADHLGNLSDAHNEEAKRAFKAGEAEIFFSSDIGAKGLNLPEASYVVEYESALTFSNRTQRCNRAHRIGSQNPLVTCWTLVARDTVEENIFARTIDRNEQQDVLLGDQEDGTAFIGADTRREMLGAHKRKRRR